MRAVVKPIKKLTGIIDIPGDKSISHRSIMIGALANSPIRITNFLAAADCLSTVKCMKMLGLKVERPDGGGLIIKGNGLYGLTEPSDVLDAGNSGTTMRLLSGILAGQPFFSVLTGDNSLKKRPMTRVISPLTKMGCRLYGRDQSRFAPLVILPAENIRGIDYEMPVASAQAKSAILFAGLFADGPTTVTEQYLSRDHSEKMLAAFGADIKCEGLRVKLNPAKELHAPPVIDIPGDISSAAFWLVAATIIPGSKLRLRNVGVNPTRTGVIDVLNRMGANITICNERRAGGEEVADLLVESAGLTGTEIEAEIIPRLVDEIPVISVAALFAKGTTIIRGAAELRVKETDRIKAIASELSKMGARLTEQEDGLIIEGGHQLNEAICESYNDHRIAMALAVAALAAKGAEIINPACVNISYPNFFSEINVLREKA